MKRTILAICAVLVTAVAFSAVSIVKSTAIQALAQQTQIVCFKILDQNGEPVIGASVRVRGTNRTSTTDIDGNVCIELKPGDVLIISYVGYQDREVQYKGQNPGIISLIPQPIEN